MIFLKNVTFGYERGRALVLDSFNGTFSPGITLIRGASGCGKSTLLRLIAGYLRPQRGTVSVPPRGGEPTREFQRCALGYVFQSLNLLPHIDVLRNLELFANMSGVRPADFDGRVAHWAGILGMTDLLRSPPARLSIGQQQRAAFMRAVLHAPLVLCLDEPTSGLDDGNCERMKAGILDFTGRTRCCLIASHDDRLLPIANAIISLLHREVISHKDGSQAALQ